MRAAGILAAVLACLALAGCGAVGVAPPKIVIQIEKVPTPAACDAHLGPAPAYPDTDAAIKAAPNVAERARLYAAGRKMRLSRQAETEAALAKCAAVPK